MKDKTAKTLSQVYTQLENEWLDEHHGTTLEEREFLRHAALAIYLKPQKGRKGKE